MYIEDPLKTPLIGVFRLTTVTVVNRRSSAIGTLSGAKIERSET
jgi:hypothetical protein